MKITYFGTAAGEGWPGVFCKCPVCQEARRLGGKNIRTRSQARINEDLLIDLPPDNQLHSLYYGLDFEPIRALLFTHSHSDHCYTDDLELLREPYTHTYPHILQVYGNESVAKKVLMSCRSFGCEEHRFRFTCIPHNEPFRVLDYTVMALQATHSRGERCLFYRIARDGKAVLYAHDTGALTEENLQALATCPEKLSLVSLDCTAQRERDGKYHMGFLDAVEQKKVLLERGLADENTVWVVNHFSHNGGWLHAELEEYARQEGFLASYDGMTVEF